MSLKRLVANEDWASFLEYLEDQEKGVVNNIMRSKTPEDMFRYQGEHRFLTKLMGLKERLKNG